MVVKGSLYPSYLVKFHVCTLGALISLQCMDGCCPTTGTALCLFAHDHSFLPFFFFKTKLM